MEPIRISIITPSFNQGSFLEQTIDSVLSQGYDNLEYVIIDGGSKDESINIIKKYEKHLKHWVSEPDRGQSDAINKGFLKCSGDVINWINSDDYYEEGALKHAGNWFQDSTVQVLCGQGRVFNKQGTVKINQGSTTFPHSVEKSFAYGRIDQPETFFRYDNFKKLMPLSLELHYCMDKEIWMKFLLIFGQKGVKYTSQQLVNFRLHESSKSFQYQVRFEMERNMIFLKFLERNRFLAQAEKLKSLISSKSNENYEWEAEASEQFVTQAWNEFLLLLADEHYFKFEYNSSKMLIASCNPTFLSNESKLLFNKLKLRLFVPKPVLKLIKRLF